MENKRSIVFEGKDINVSSTMKKIQEAASQSASRIQESYAKSSKSAKDYVELMNQEIEAQKKLAQAYANDKKWEANEKYKKQLEELNRQESERIRRIMSSDFSDKAKEQYSTGIREKFEEERQKLSESLKEQLASAKNFLEEQKQTNELLKYILEQDKQLWEREVSEDRQQVQRSIDAAKREGIENLSPQERAKVQYQEALLRQDSPQKRSIISDILGAGLIRDIGGMIPQMIGARDAFDLIPGISSLMGAGTGTVSGLGIEALTLGKVDGAVIGAEIGKQAGAFAGQAAAKYFEEAEQLERSQLRFRATIGRGAFGEGSMSAFGVSQVEANQLATELYRAAGSGNRAMLSDMLGAEFGFGLNRGDLMSRAGQLRVTGGNFGDQMRNMVGVAEAIGIPRVLFADMLRNQNQLIEMMSQTRSAVDPRNALGLMMDLNNMGGMFTVSDPRSMRMMQIMQQGLSSPSSPFQQAFGMDILRQMDPNASLVDILQMQEQGFAGDRGREFLKRTVDTYSNMFGGDVDLTTLALRQVFPGMPIEAIKNLISGRGEIGATPMDILQQEASITDRGGVSTRSVMQAEVKDAWSTGVIEGMTAASEQLGEIVSEVMNKAIKDATDNIYEEVTGKFTSIFSRDNE